MGSGGLAPGQAVPRTGGGITAAAGRQSGAMNDRRFGDIQHQECVENFKKTWKGGIASGIAGARWTNTPEYKQAEQAACPPSGQAPAPKPAPTPNPAAPPAGGAAMGGATPEPNASPTMAPPPGFTPNTLTGGR